MRWMFANEPEMAHRWAEHTPSIENLPEKVDESLLNEITPGEDPDLDPDECEEMEAQLTGQEVESGDDAIEPEGEPVQGEVSTDDYIAAMESDDEEESVAEPAVQDEPAVDEPERRGRGPEGQPVEYSKRFRSQAGPANIFAPRFKIDPESPEGAFPSVIGAIRDDIMEFDDEIDDLNDQGYTFGRIAKILNKKYGLRSNPEDKFKKSGRGAPSLKSLRCDKCQSPIERTDSEFICSNPECGQKIKRAFTPTQVADYLKGVGRMLRGPASPFQDLGSRMEDSEQWSTSFDSDYNVEDDSDLVDGLRYLGQMRGEFTTGEAVEAMSKLLRFHANVKTPHFDPCESCGDTRRVKKHGNLVCRGCGKKKEFGSEEELEDYILHSQPKFYEKVALSDTTLPKDHKNLLSYIFWALQNLPNDFQPKDPKSLRKQDRFNVVWEYIGEEDDDVQDLFEMFGEAISRPPGSKPFQDWNSLGQNGMELKKQADALKGTTYQTQDGQLMFYKNQMQTGEQPMIADMTQGIWSPSGQQTTSAHPNQQQSTPQMGSVFASKE